MLVCPTECLESRDRAVESACPSSCDSPESGPQGSSRAERASEPVPPKNCACDYRSTQLQTTSLPLAIGPANGRPSPLLPARWTNWRLSFVFICCCCCYCSHPASFLFFSVLRNTQHATRPSTRLTPALALALVVLPNLLPSLLAHRIARARLVSLGGPERSRRSRPTAIVSYWGGDGMRWLAHVA